MIFFKISYYIAVAILHNNTALTDRPYDERFVSYDFSPGVILRQKDIYKIFDS